MDHNVSQKQKYFWNMMGSICNSFSTVILLLFVNRILGETAGGIFSFAYANAQLMLIIGGMEVRPIQSTDVNKEYSFQTYFTLRVISCVTMIFVCMIYIISSGINGEKAIVVFVFCMFKLIEAFTDVFMGVYQQKDRIDLCGKVFAIRVICSTTAFVITLIVTKNLIYGGIAMVVASLAMFLIYDLPLSRRFKEICMGLSTEKMGSLIRTVLPLFISAFIMMYINNAPKYAINNYCSDDIQNRFSILFMPAFVINLFSIFVFRPVLVDMTICWKKFNIAGVLKYIKRSVFCITGMTIVCVVGGVLVGIPVLSALYGIDLSSDKFVLVIIMIFGGLSAFATYFYYVITVMRGQNKLLIGYVCSFVVAAVLSPIMVKKFFILGAAIASAIALLLLDIIFVVIIICSIHKHREEGEKERE